MNLESCNPKQPFQFGCFGLLYHDSFFCLRKTGSHFDSFCRMSGVATCLRETGSIVRCLSTVHIESTTAQFLKKNDINGEWINKLFSLSTPRILENMDLDLGSYNSHNNLQKYTSTELYSYMQYLNMYGASSSTHTHNSYQCSPQFPKVFPVKFVSWTWGDERSECLAFLNKHRWALKALSWMLMVQKSGSPVEGQVVEIPFLFSGF